LSFNGDLNAGDAGEDLTTKGDLHGFDTANTRIPVGADGTVLTADSTTALGLAYSTSAANVLTTQGDVLYHNASGLARLAAGVSGQQLQTQGAGADPIWVTAAGGATAEIDNATFNSDFTTTSTSLVDITNLNVTIGDITNGVTMLSCSMNINRSTSGGTGFELTDDSTAIQKTERSYEFTSSSLRPTVTIPLAMSADGSVIQARGYTGGGTLSVYGTDAGDKHSQIESISVG